MLEKTYSSAVSSSMLRSEDLDLVFKLGLLLEKLISFAGKTFSCLKRVSGVEAARKISIKLALRRHRMGELTYQEQSGTPESFDGTWRDSGGILIVADPWTAV